MFKFYRTTVGKKAVMAVTGLGLVAFCIAHMVGNLKVFQGIDIASGRYKMDVYGEFLRTVGAPIFSRGELLWVARIGLLAMAVLHIASAVLVTRANRNARVAYAAPRDFGATTFAARTMWWGGLILACFIIFHLLHMTTGHMHFQGFEHGRVHHNVVSAFRVWYITGLYVASMAVLCLHVYHGCWSALQTLGLTVPKHNKVLRNASKVIGIVLFLGFIAVPVGVFLGVVQ